MTITRNSERRRAIRNTALVALGVSGLVHLLGLATVVPAWVEKLSEPVPPAEKQLEVAAVYEEVEEVEEVPEPEPLPQPPEPAPPEPTRPVPPQPVVEQHEPNPERVDAAGAMVEPQASPPPTEQAPAEPAEPPAETAARAEAAEPPVSPVILQQRPDPRALLVPDAQVYERIFEQADVQAAATARERARGKRLFEGYEEESLAVQTALKSFSQNVRPGNHVGVNPKSGAFGSYIGAIHQKIHGRWAHGYLMDLDLHEPAGSPMNDPNLNTTLEFVIRATDGVVESVHIVRSSGQLRFDAQAVAVAHAIGPHPNPPPSLVSPDGRVYVHWNFWRDQRQCGLFGARIYLVGEQGSPG